MHLGTQKQQKKVNKMCSNLLIEGDVPATLTSVWYIEWAADCLLLCLSCGVPAPSGAFDCSGRSCALCSQQLIGRTLLLFE